MKKTLLMLLVLALMLVAITPAGAQDTETDASANKPVVYAVFLYSSTCPHCRTFILEDLPDIQEEFGDSLILIAFDMSNSDAQAAGRIIYERMGVPPTSRVVPMMIIGNEVLSGGTEIPTRMPGIVREGLAAGGIGLPPVPELQDAYGGMVQNNAANNQTAPIEEATLAEKLAADPTANAMAVAILIALVGSAAMVVWAGIRSLSPTKADKALLEKLNGTPGWAATLLAAVVGLIIAITLISQAHTDSLATPLAWVVVVAFLVISGAIFLAGMRSTRAQARFSLPAWLLPLVVAAGVVVAFYLAYVETNEVEAVCGAVGNCNAVQQSEYARLLGILPIGVLGIMGYALILGTWLIGRLNQQRFSQWANVIILMLALFGVLFSIYLTFLEPFVIGATCAWCLTSAVVMMLILWMVAADGLSDLSAILGRRQPA